MRSFIICTHQIVRAIKLRSLGCTGQVSHLGEKSTAYQCGLKPEGKRPLVRPNRGWEGGIKMSRNEILSEGMDFLRMGSNCGRF